jgi:hypothetical protein
MIRGDRLGGYRQCIKTLPDSTVCAFLLLLVSPGARRSHRRARMDSLICMMNGSSSTLSRCFGLGHLMGDEDGATREGSVNGTKKEGGGAWHGQGKNSATLHV